jgi:hypothetical protein
MLTRIYVLTRDVHIPRYQSQLFIWLTGCARCHCPHSFLLPCFSSPTVKPSWLLSLRETVVSGGETFLCASPSYSCQVQGTTLYPPHASLPFLDTPSNPHMQCWLRWEAETCGGCILPMRIRALAVSKVRAAATPPPSLLFLCLDSCTSIHCSSIGN